MSNDKSTASAGGVGFFGLLAVLFIGLKLTSVIDWSWWWVLAPLWMPVLIFTALFLVSFLICFGVEEIRRRRRRGK